MTRRKNIVVRPDFQIVIESKPGEMFIIERIDISPETRKNLTTNIPDVNSPSNPFRKYEGKAKGI